MIVVTSLLTEGGKQGGRVVGATGVNTRTGEFYVFKSKATIIATSGVGRLFGFAPEISVQAQWVTSTLPVLVRLLAGRPVRN